ncbi:hypothetical protein J2752_002134 [Halarchaeum rubridurum]|uniref:Uncharacterized protein n=1 Tax=Halarchaeum rubridurum TaxID=489911 RepID=A0A830FZK8_9EURY|nr:hypothetical protein [Halarchaeum rubridurum]MBP1955222.1 hypothetical protein [Halarchaeum rubridurum]GGM68010.1 hypothetical protein GCM10009017_17750 [Halarchaeum rubridurum]
MVLAPAGALAQPTGTPAATDRPGGANQVCFDEPGHELGMGNESRGVTIDGVVHTSLFEHLMTRGGVGVEMYGKLNGSTILALRTGVVFDGVQNPGRFVSNPFDSFAVVYDYRFQFPMFSALTGNDFGHSSSDAGIEGVEEAECSWGDGGASNASGHSNAGA